MTRRPSRRLQGFDKLEKRQCLSAVTFVEEQRIGAELNSYAVPADVDSDGDLDLVSAVNLPGLISSKIVWYKNTGDGFGEAQIITDDVDEPWSLFTGDIDGDGDLDVLSASRRGAKIAWYENSNGSGSFSSQRVITTSADGVSSIVLGDLDGDGDLDVIAASGFVQDGQVAWYENTDGNGTYSEASVIAAGMTFFDFWSQGLATDDLDGDGDLDVVLAESGSNRVVWFENIDEAGGFSPSRTVANDVTEVVAIKLADLDGDGDRDILTGSYGDGIRGKLSWYENTNGDGSFGLSRVIATPGRRVESVFVADVDQDGDEDVVYATWPDEVSWMENIDGTGTFGTAHKIPNSRRPGPILLVARPRHVFAGDWDLDGDLDVAYSSWIEEKLVWFENRIIGDVNDDGIFDSGDLVKVFQASEYEDGIASNTMFDEGDWNQDGEFDSSDLVLAFQAAHYVAAARPIRGEFAAAADWLFSQEDDTRRTLAFVA